MKTTIGLMVHLDIDEKNGNVSVVSVETGTREGMVTWGESPLADFRDPRVGVSNEPKTAQTRLDALDAELEALLIRFGNSLKGGEA
jgi:hypothetical protein